MFSYHASNVNLSCKYLLVNFKNISKYGTIYGSHISPWWTSIVRFLLIYTWCRFVIFVTVIRRAWWRHQMETLSTLLAICAGNSPVTDELPTQRPVTRSFDVFFYLRLNKRLHKQWWGWWFGMPSRPLCLHCKGHITCILLHKDNSVEWSVTMLAYIFQDQLCVVMIK